MSKPEPIAKIDNLNEFTEVIYNKLYKSHEDSWLSFHYRGESRLYKDPKFSSYFRTHNTPRPEREIEEVKLFQKTEYAISLLKTFEEKEIGIDHYIWWFLTQHHSEKGKDITEEHRHFETTLLDITRNPLIALYFCCCDNHDEDGRVYVFYDLKKAEIPKNNYKTYQDYILDSQNKFKKNQLISIDYSNLPNLYEVTKRLIAQSGEFIVQPDRYPQAAFVLVALKDSKRAILHELDFLFHINSITLLLE